MLFTRWRRRAIQESAAAPAVEAVRSDLVAVTERSIRRDGTTPLRLISPGLGSSGYYSPEVLEDAAANRVFPAGLHMYIDHPTLSERSDRPERSLRDLAAVLETDGIWQPNHPEGPGIYAQARIFGPYQALIAEMADHIGVSIRATAEMSRGDIDGHRVPIVERLVEATSVDFVTRPGRGGAVLAVLESAGIHEAMADDVRSWLRNELRARYETGDDQWVWVRDFDPDTGTVIFDLEGDRDELDPGTYQLAYTSNDDGVDLADTDPIPVRVVTSYDPVTEARNVGEWFQSRIHLHFTTLADDMFGEGRLTKEERITLSNGIGAALDAFSAVVDDKAPQLLTRDLWDNPNPDNESVTESEEDTMTPEQITEAVTAAIAPLAERVDAIEAAAQPSTEEVDESADVRAARAEENLRVFAAREHLRSNDRLAKLPAATQARVIEALANQAPADDDGNLDTSALDEAADKAIKAEVTYLAEATGNTVRGVGDTTDPTGDTPTIEEATSRLEAEFTRMGLDETTAKIAVGGRR